MKKIVSIIIAVILLISATLSLVACTDIGGGSTSTISSADGEGKGIVLCETEFDVFKDDFAVGTPTITFDEVKAKFQSIENSIVVIYGIYDDDENYRCTYTYFDLGNILEVSYTENGEKQFSQEIQTGQEYYWRENTEQWSKTYLDDTPDYADHYAEVIDAYVNDPSEMFGDNAVTIEFDDNSIVYKLVEDGIPVELRIKKYFNYSWTLPETELVD